MRRRVAASLRAAVHDAETSRPPHLGSRVPVSRGAVIPLREGLIGLAERLESTARVNPRGVARALDLVTDGTSPLFTASREHDQLIEALWEIVDALNLCPPHAWSCPVIMKLDPEFVAWTCAHCGTTAKSPGPPPGPE